ncbi:MAG TPA: hypothetical protein VFC33_11720 [Acidimicrobiia bacterium]|nr:hypothetical protein [Acidimicrobiia bacterium]
MSGRRAACGVVAAALVAAVSSCGGSSHSISKPEYVTRASAVCRDADRAVNAVRGDATDTTALATSIGRVLSIERDAVKRVRAIPPPRADEPALDHWLDLVDRSLDEVDDARQASEHGDAAAAAAANARGADLAQQATEAARAYGITACVTG